MTGVFARLDYIAWVERFTPQCAGWWPRRCGVRLIAPPSRGRSIWAWSSRCKVAKSNEIEELLQLLELHGAVVTFRYPAAEYQIA